jgi:activator of HSP90 ATPase
MNTEEYFNTIATQRSLKHIGDIIAKEILKVMSLEGPWNISQRWGKCDVYANLYKDIIVRVEFKGMPVLIYKNGTALFKMGSWIKELRNSCLEKIKEGTFKRVLKEMQEDAEEINNCKLKFLGWNALKKEEKENE